MKNLYSILGVPSSASADEIRRAYLKLAKEHHPDLNGGCEKAEERFKRVQEAYEVLGDARKRANYDGAGSGSAGFGSGGQSSYAGGAGAHRSQHSHSRHQYYEEGDAYSESFRRSQRPWRSSGGFWSGGGPRISGPQMAAGGAAVLALLLVAGGLSAGVDALWERNNAGKLYKPAARATPPPRPAPPPDTPAAPDQVSAPSPAPRS
eukprot:tig00001487_g8937.t1